MDYFVSPRGNSPILQLIGFWAGKFYNESATILMYLHLLASGVMPIYIGSFASLRCPPSAQDPSKKKKVSSTLRSEDDETDNDESDEGSEFGGFIPSDAIVFPIVAACVLTVFYVLIKWLEDPAIINKILGFYFSIFGLSAISTMVGDFLGVITSFVFPKAWSKGTTLFRIDPLLRQQVTDVPFSGVDRSSAQHVKFADKVVPLPGILSNLRLPERYSQIIWSIRSLLTDHWVLKVFLQGAGNTKGKVRFNQLVGLAVGMQMILFYNFYRKAWWISNLMAWGMCYTTLQWQSVTTFATGSLILSGLFFYDIVMVFYTPMMITVATNLDVPIKISIPSPSVHGGMHMLGLGDIVLPGFMIALALRFDLHLFYLRKSQIKKPVPSNKAIAAAFPNSVQTISTATEAEKPTYVTATGNWGTSFWTRSMPKDKLPPNLKGLVFPRVYFWASTIGYVLGLCITLTVLKVTRHGQPALLYLVPCVLGSLWGTAFFRGEIKDMWAYDESPEEIGEGSTEADTKNGDKELGHEQKTGVATIESKGGATDKNTKKSQNENTVFSITISKPRRSTVKEGSVGL